MPPRTLAARLIALVLLSCLPSRAGSLSLSVMASGRTTPEGGEWRVVGALVVPLQRLLSPAEGRVRYHGFAQTEDRAAPRRELSGAEMETPERQPSRRPGRRATPDGERGSRALVRPLPPAVARRAVAEALRASGFTVTRRRLESLASRSRSSALLPELMLRAGRSTDQALRLTPTISDPDRYTQSGGSDFWGEARLTWKLDRLVFADDELAVERLGNQRIQSELRLVGQVLDALFTWQRAKARAADPALLPEERLAATFDWFEAEATLDVLTAGWFSRWAVSRSSESLTRRPKRP